MDTFNFVFIDYHKAYYVKQANLVSKTPVRHHKTASARF